MNKEILDLAEQSNPEIMRKVASALDVIQHMAPEFLPEVLQEFENITEVTQEKVASSMSAMMGSPAMRSAGRTAIGVAAIVGTGIGASLGTAIASDLFDAAKRGLTKGRNFKRIMEANPNLRSDVADKTKLKPAFDALHRFAPDFMSDPLIGGGLLRQVANMPSGNEFALIEKLIGSRKNLLDVKDKQHRPDWKAARESLQGSRKNKAPGE